MMQNEFGVALTVVGLSGLFTQVRLRSIWYIGASSGLLRVIHDLGNLLLLASTGCFWLYPRGKEIVTTFIIVFPVEIYFSIVTHPLGSLSEKDENESPGQREWAPTI